MFRYYALASAIVVVAIGILLALPRFRPSEPHGPAYASGRATPGVSGPDAEVRATDTVGGIAPWALSAVPECFHQTASFRGGSAFVRAHVPHAARRVPAGSRLRVADCTLDVRADFALLARAENRFVVPSPATFYVSGSSLVLRQTDGSRDELRVYRLSHGAVPRFDRLRDRVYSYE